MKIGVMISDVIGSLFKKPVTISYPLEPSPAPERYRGQVLYEPDKCTGCLLCCKECPANALDLVIIDRKTKKFVMKYRADRCVYCGQCVISCRFKALAMSNTIWELASLINEPLLLHQGRIEDIQYMIEKEKAGESITAAQPVIKITPLKAEIEYAEPFLAKGASGRNDDDGK